MALKTLARKQPTSDGDTASLRRFTRQLGDIPILHGQSLEFAYQAGQQSVYAGHSLGRCYIGGFVYATDGLFAATVAYPEVTAQGGQDPAKGFYLVCQAAPTVDCHVRVWLF